VRMIVVVVGRACVRVPGHGGGDSGRSGADVALRVGGEHVAAALAAEMVRRATVVVRRLTRVEVDRHAANGIDGRRQGCGGCHGGGRWRCGFVRMAIVVVMSVAVVVRGVTMAMRVAVMVAAVAGVIGGRLRHRTNGGGDGSGGGRTVAVAVRMAVAVCVAAIVGTAMIMVVGMTVGVAVIVAAVAGVIGRGPRGGRLLAGH